MTEQSPYGRVTHHLFEARDELRRHNPASDDERWRHAAAMLHLDSVILLVRRLHHQFRFWKRG